MEDIKMERIVLPTTLPAKDSHFAAEILRRIRAVLIPSSGGQWFTTEGAEGLQFHLELHFPQWQCRDKSCPGFM